MAVPNTLLVEKWAVANWGEWNSLPENIQTQLFYFSQKIYVVQEKEKLSKKLSLFI